MNPSVNGHPTHPFRLQSSADTSLSPSPSRQLLSLSLQFCQVKLKPASLKQTIQQRLSISISQASSKSCGMPTFICRRNLETISVKLNVSDGVGVEKWRTKMTNFYWSRNLSRLALEYLHKNLHSLNGDRDPMTRPYFLGIRESETFGLRPKNLSILR